MSAVTRTAEDDLVDAVAAGASDDPFAVLGPHVASRDGRHVIAVRTMQPSATRVELLIGDQVTMMERRHRDGLFEAAVDAEGRSPRDLFYRLRIHEGNEVREAIDPYRFGPVLTDFDLHLFAEGTHYRAWEKLGSRRDTVEGLTGVHFAVWAPNAQRVSVIGDFNSWDGRVHPMRKLVPSGVWEIFIPELRDGACYKFEIRTTAGHLLHKTDPYGRYFEVPPNTASVVVTEQYNWRDADWMRDRPSFDGWRERPMSIYEVHPGSWRRVPEEGNRYLSYRELADTLVPYVREMGYTHIELMPVMEHPFGGSWGYQVIGFFAPTSRYGTPDEFRYFVDECHRHGLGVILDWVPGHFPKDRHGLAEFDGTALYEHADPRKGEHQDWGTLIFNYGRNEVRTFLLSNALFWLEEFHVDGLRVDAVASMLYLDYSRQAGQWIPNQFGGRENLEAVDFLKQLNMLTHGRVPGTITVAEESTAWPAVSRPVYVGGLGFSYKWNMGWMHDMLEYMKQDPVHRRWHHNQVTFSMLYAFTENFVLPFSHDEVVHGKRAMIDKMPGDLWQKHANLRSLYGYMFAHPGKKLMFMGAELGQWREWNYDGSLDWHLLQYSEHEGLRRWIQDLNHTYQHEQSLHEVDFDYAGFQWIDCCDNENSVMSFLRRAKNPQDFTVIVTNFTPVPRVAYRVGVPEGGWYRELLNSDSARYGGSNMGNGGGGNAEMVPMHGFEYSMSITVPPLGFLLFKR
ncbi:MAG TPA: 1,4-alpha-glucan branching protein GlgB [Vicinamibacterales bacterium]|jgi:1,4-alpha-glucan branching enzyme|nr:1,4-alpha-glucan branching protein GlgB [Vicinamibacterales bacterium]